MSKIVSLADHIRAKQEKIVAQKVEEIAQEATAIGKDSHQKGIDVTQNTTSMHLPVPVPPKPKLSIEQLGGMLVPILTALDRFGMSQSEETKSPFLNIAINAQAVCFGLLAANNRDIDLDQKGVDQITEIILTSGITGLQNYLNELKSKNTP